MYPRAVSPHLEAARLRQPIRLARVAAWVRAQERGAARSAHTSHALHDTACTLIESAGAVFSPLGARSTNLDLARTLGPALWIVVAPDALGVLHDVRATWTALGAFGRLPDHLILNASRQPDASTGTNARELPRVGLPPPSAVVGRGTTDPAVLARLLRKLRLRTSDQ
jgi:dethiobiotin synthetase